MIIPLVWLHVLKKCLCVWFARTHEYWTRCCRISWHSLAILTPELTPTAGRARLLSKQHERLDKACILLVMLCLKHGSVAFNNLWKSVFLIQYYFWSQIFVFKYVQMCWRCLYSCKSRSGKCYCLESEYQTMWIEHYGRIYGFCE